MIARTWQEWGEGSILCRAGDCDPPDAPAIRAYVRLNGYRTEDEAFAATCSWEVTAEGPYGACDLVRGEAEDLDEARELAQAALVAITGCL